MGPWWVQLPGPGELRGPVRGSLARGYRNRKDSGVPLWLGVPQPGDVGSLFGTGGGGSGSAPPASCAPAFSTILVEPGCQAEVTDTGDIRISVGAEVPSLVGAQLDPIHLSIFSHRFMSIAGEWLPGPHGPAPWAEVVQARGWQAVQRETKCDPGKGQKWSPRWRQGRPGTASPAAPAGLGQWEHLTPASSHGA